jgi:hypothetical protein
MINILVPANAGFALIFLLAIGLPQAFLLWTVGSFLEAFILSFYWDYKYFPALKASLFANFLSTSAGMIIHSILMPLYAKDFSWATVDYLVILYVFYFIVSIGVETIYYLIRRMKIGVDAKKIIIGSILANTASYVLIALIFGIIMLVQ